MVSQKRHLSGDRPQILRDVTGVGILSEYSFVATTSPIYGRPGLYFLNCRASNMKLLVAPQSINKSYPEGADYFELESLAMNKISYYYGVDVDKVDFLNFRTPKYIKTYTCLK